MNLLSGLIGALVGAIVGGFATFYSTRWALVKSQGHFIDNQRSDRDRFIFALLQALYDEIDALWESHLVDIGTPLENLPEGAYFSYHIPIHQEIFVIYRSNAGALGYVDDHDLRRAIVMTYTKGGEMLNSVIYNNSLLDKIDLFQHQPRTEANQLHLNRAVMQAIDYAKSLRQTHKDLKGLHHDVMRRLNMKGVISVREPVRQTRN